MNNHLHLLVPAERSSADLQHQLSEVLRRTVLRCRLGARKFDPVPDPRPVPDEKHLLRQIRYIHLNPCRSNQVQDPLVWEFSTHRDALGLRLLPWLGVQKTLNMLGYARLHDRVRFHRYVSSDPSCLIQGTPWLLDAKSNSVPVYGVPDILESVQAMMQQPSMMEAHHARTAIEKFYLYSLLRDQGYRQSSLLREVIGVSRNWLYLAGRKGVCLQLPLLRTYLADSRLRTHWGGGGEWGA